MKTFSTLNPIGDGGHHLRSEAHRQLYCGRKLGRSELNCGVAVLRLVGAHCRDDRACTPVLCRQRLEMPGKMLFDLTLGFGEKRQIPLVAQCPGGGADGKRSGVPKRVQQAETTSQLANPVCAPREMVLLLPRRLLERASGLFIACGQR